MYNLFLVYFVNVYMFRAYLGPSSGGTTVCIQQLVLFILFKWLSVVQVGAIVVYIPLYLLMMGLDTPETCRGSRNMLRISCASSWFFFTRTSSKFLSILYGCHPFMCNTNQTTLIRSNTTQVYFNSNWFPLNVRYMFRTVLRPSSGMSIQKSYKGIYSKIIRDRYVQSLFV